MGSLIESIRQQGIISPLIVRAIESTDEYEVISGHRRLHAAVKAGLSEVPALIYPLDRNEAMIAVVDSNLHRERLLPSEKAFSPILIFSEYRHWHFKCNGGLCSPLTTQRSIVKCVCKLFSKTSNNSAKFHKLSREDLSTLLVRRQ